MKMVCTFDRVSGAFNLPVCVVNLEVFKREIADALYANPQHQMARHYGDYDIYVIGEYDPHTAVITAYPQPSYVCRFADFYTPSTAVSRPQSDHEVISADAVTDTKPACDAE